VSTKRQIENATRMLLVIKWFPEKSVTWSRNTLREFFYRCCRTHCTSTCHLYFNSFETACTQSKFRFYHL